MLSVDALLTFVAIVDEGSFSAAAERLGQTPSGISRTVSRLEKQLGVNLITRTTRRLDLTEEGRWLLGRARQIRAALQDTESRLLASLSQPSGLVRVNAATPVLNHLIAPIVPGFLARHPLVKLELIGAEAVVDLIEERADVAIRIGALADSTLNARRLGESRLRLVAAPDYLRRQPTPVSLANLATHSLIGFTAPASLNVWPLNDGDQAGWTVDPTLAASSGETLRHLALSGAGIACLAEFLVGEDVRAGRLEVVLPEQTLPWTQPIWAVFYKQGGLAPRIACFVDHVARELRL